MLDIFNNKISFLRLKPQKIFILILIFLIIFISLIIFMIKNSIYDNYQTKGYVTCEENCTIVTAIPSNIDFEIIYLNDKKLNYEIISKELKVDEENFISYYELKISCNRKLDDKEIVKLNFYYNKQRIIKKIKAKMF